MATPSSIEEQNARNMKDFMQLYNRLTQSCFQRCVLDFQRLPLTETETKCINVCAERYIGYNQRVMLTFMEFQNAKQEAAIKEMERAAAARETPNLPGLVGSMQQGASVQGTDVQGTSVQSGSPAGTVQAAVGS